jgi:hypothetical protein
MFTQFKEHKKYCTYFQVVSIIAVIAFVGTLGTAVYQKRFAVQNVPLLVALLLNYFQARLLYTMCATGV